MTITVKHTKVSTVPDGDDTSVVRPSDWNDDHALTGLGTMAEQNANAVAITGGTISGVTLPASNITGTLDVGHGGTGATTLTGYVKGNGTSTMTASTTIPNTDITGLGTASTKDAGVANGVATLDSGGQVPLSQLPPLGDLNYQGTWNATTNTPTLTSSVGTKGYYYVVSVAGTTNLNGITDWQIGDWAVFNGSVWQKVDNTDAVTSVNGYTGTVVLNAADVGAVPYTGATGAVDLNAKSLVNVSNLGVNTTTVPTIKIRAVGDNNSSSRIAMRGYSSDANSSAIRVSKFRGTVAAPQAPLSGDSLGKFELAGYGTTSADAYPQSSLEGVATENWGATARGAKAVVKVTPNTTTTQVTALTIDQDSKATFANTVTANGTLLTGNTGTVTSVAATAGTGISVSGSPITTSGTLTITNTAPDQTVAIASGTGISVSGTYPNFTVTNTAPSSGGTVTSVSGTTGRITSTGGTTPVIDLASGVATAGTTGSSTLIPVVTIDTYGRVTGITTAANPQGTVTSVTGTAPVVSSGGATPAISMAAANTTTNGYLTSTDWNTFNGKGSGSVTSVAALTLGTTGTDLSSTVANGTTTPVITLQVPTASATNRGALSSTDWSTFNGKQAALVSGTNIKTVNGTSLLGSGDVGTIDVAHGGTGITTLTAGYIPYGAGTSAFASSANLFWDSANSRLGVGTATPAVQFEISNATSGLARITSLNGASQLQFKSSGTNLQYISYNIGGAGALSFYDSNSAAERMRIDASGNLLIGTTSDLGKLSVAGSNSSGAGSLQGCKTSNLNIFYVDAPTYPLGVSCSNGGSTELVRFYSVGTAVGTISYNGSVVLYNATSDRRLKSEIMPFIDSGTYIDKFKPCSFTWANGTKDIGFIADEYQNVIPQAVSGQPDGVGKDNKPEYQQVDFSSSAKMAIIIAELQSLRARLKAANID